VIIVYSAFLCTDIIGLTWNEFSEDNFDMKNAAKVLDEDHYGLELVKDRLRILEHLAVLQAEERI
jgi:ATP-dependent Lon protease